MSLIGLLAAREKGVVRTSTQEAHSVVSKMELVYPRIPGDVYPNSDLSPPASSMVNTGGEHPPGTALTPFITRSLNIY